jgi:hypothetical protein
MQSRLHRCYQALKCVSSAAHVEIHIPTYPKHENLQVPQLSEGEA